MRSLGYLVLPAAAVAVLSVLAQGMGYAALAGSFNNAPTPTKLFPLTALASLIEWVVPDLPHGLGSKIGVSVRILGSSWDSQSAFIYLFLSILVLESLSWLGFAAFAFNKVPWGRWLWPERKTQTPSDRLASPGQRLAAVLFDALTLGAPPFLCFWLGNILGPFTPGVAAGLMALAGFWIVGFGLWQLSRLHSYGWTLGKKAMGIRIISVATGKNGGLPQNLVLRWMVTSMVRRAVPLALLVDVLFIFRQDHRCLHDLIAGTEVVKIED